MTSRKKKSLHHEATADVIEVLAADVGAKKRDLLGTGSLATPGLSATIGRHVKNARLVKNVLSALHVRQQVPNVLHVALLHGIAVKVLSSQVTAVTRDHLELLRSSQISRPGKKRSAHCR